MIDVASETASCLHFVAAPSGKALADCLAQSRPGDAILFLDAGVLHLLGPDVSARAEAGQTAAGRTLLFAAVDLEAHGLLAAARAAEVAIAADADVCALLAAHAHCLSWT